MAANRLRQPGNKIFGNKLKF